MSSMNHSLARKLPGFLVIETMARSCVPSSNELSHTIQITLANHNAMPNTQVNPSACLLLLTLRNELI